MEKVQQKIQFSPEELAFIQANWQMPGRAFLAAFEECFGPGLTFGYWRHYKYTNRLTKQTQVSWTPEQVQFLVDNYQRLGNVEIAAHFGWQNTRKKGEKRVWKKMLQMGLVRSEKERQRLKSCNGKKVATAGVERRRKAGGPLTFSPFYKEEGERWQRKDGTWMVKHQGKIEFLARHLWIQSFKKIPRGLVVGYHNGDKNDCRLENLCLLTRAQHAKKNIAKSCQGLSDNYVVGITTLNDPTTRELIKQHPELIELQRQRLLLNRKIKSIQNGEQ